MFAEIGLPNFLPTDVASLLGPPDLVLFHVNFEKLLEHDFVAF